MDFYFDGSMMVCGFTSGIIGFIDIVIKTLYHPALRKKQS